MNVRKFFAVVICLALSVMIMGTSMTAQAKKKKEETDTSKQDIVTIAENDKNFSTLVAALKAAGLTDTLKGDGPFTVFAPTNDAFAKLPAGTVDELLKPENKDKLTDILTYHVFAGKVTAADAAKLDGQEVTMANNKPVKISVKGDDLFINGAKVVIKDIVAKNGIIHVIDMVLVPEK